MYRQQLAPKEVWAGIMQVVKTYAIPKKEFILYKQEVISKTEQRKKELELQVQTLDADIKKHEAEKRRLEKQLQTLNEKSEGYQRIERRLDVLSRVIKEKTGERTHAKKRLARCHEIIKESELSIQSTQFQLKLKEQSMNRIRTN